MKDYETMDKSIERIDDVDLLGKDGDCTKPNLLPGDIIETVAGNIGVITGAHTMINGSTTGWNEALPNVIEHGWSPSYSVEFFERSGVEKYAWWSASEFKRIVALGVSRDYLPNRVSN